MDLNQFLRPEVRIFAAHMERKLRKNDHKAGWDNALPAEMEGRLDEEVAGLHQAVDAIRGYGPSRVRVVDVWEEAADVGNFAMMLAQVATDPKWDD